MSTGPWHQDDSSELSGSSDATPAVDLCERLENENLDNLDDPFAEDEDGDSDDLEALCHGLISDDETGKDEQAELMEDPDCVALASLLELPPVPEEPALPISDRTMLSFVEAYSRINVVRNDRWAAEWVKHSRTGEPFSERYRTRYAHSPENRNSRDAPTPWTFRCIKTADCTYWSYSSLAVEKHEVGCTLEKILKQKKIPSSRRGRYPCTCPLPDCPTPTALFDRGKAVSNHLAEVHGMTDPGEMENFLPLQHPKRQFIKKGPCPAGGGCRTLASSGSSTLTHLRGVHGMTHEAAALLVQQRCYEVVRKPAQVRPTKNPKNLKPQPSRAEGQSETPKKRRPRQRALKFEGKSWVKGQLCPKPGCETRRCIGATDMRRHLILKHKMAELDATNEVLRVGQWAPRPSKSKLWKPKVWKPEQRSGAGEPINDASGSLHGVTEAQKEPNVRYRWDDDQDCPLGNCDARRFSTRSLLVQHLMTGSHGMNMAEAEATVLERGKFSLAKRQPAVLKSVRKRKLSDSDD